jgi:hypothetical protein
MREQAARNEFTGFNEKPPNFAAGSRRVILFRQASNGR